MNNEFSHLEELVHCMRTAGILPEAAVISNLENLKNPNLKIAFVGKFQTGKSHIINKLFLKGNQLLQEGNGLCMSAVTIAVRYGKQTQLTHCNRSVGKIVTILNPQAANIAPLTAAEKSNDREEIYQTIDNVSLEYPNSDLEHVILFDTPGIDDPNDSLLRETTYKLLPDVDAIVLVVPPQGLSRIELRFLQKKIFFIGINRFIVLISKKNGTLLGGGGLNNIINEIKGQLASIGKAEIPLYIYGEEKGIPIPDHGVKVDQLILGTAKDFAVANRYAKAKRAIEKQLREEIYRLGLQSSVYCKTENELNLMKIEALKKLEEMKQTLDELRNDFDAHMTVQRNSNMLGFQTDLARIRERFIQKLKNTDDLSKAQESLDAIDGILTSQIEDAAVVRIEQFHSEIEKLFQHMKNDLRSHWKNETFDALMGEVDGGMVQNWNATLLTLGDYLLSAMVLPGGVLLSIGLRFLLGKIPVLRELAPANILKSHMINTVSESLDRQFAYINDDFRNTLTTAQEKVVRFLSEESDQEIVRQKTVLESIEEQKEKSDYKQNIEEIQQQIEAVSDLLKRIS